MNLFSLGGIVKWFWEAINSLWLMICRIIYKFINFLYLVFERVANINLFSEEVFKEITGRIYVIIGIAMLFIFAYNLILMIINPEDKKGTGAMTKVVKETIISLVVVVLLPTIFNYLYIFQTHVLDSNIIGQIILGGVGNTSGDTSKCAANDYECKCDFSKFEELQNVSEDMEWYDYIISGAGEFFTGGLAHTKFDGNDMRGMLTAACNYYRSDEVTDAERGARSIAPTIFSAFYRPANYTFEQCTDYLMNNKDFKSDEEKKICVNFFFDVSMSKYMGDIRYFADDSYLNDLIADPDNSSMEFDWLFAIIAGGLAVWMFLCYAMEIGVRVAKLGLLQLLSPVAVMMRIIPGQKEKIYTKWFNQLRNTYLDVFIRLFIIYFALFAISLIPEVFETLWNSGTGGGENGFIKTLAMVIVILGILKFAQEAPALIKEFFGDSGRFALRSPKKQFSENKLAMGGLGLIGGGASGLVKNFNHAKANGQTTGKAILSALGGAGSGAVRGARAGAKSQTFKDLKYNTSQAVDRTLMARDKRDIRQMYDKEHGKGSYRALGRKEAMDKWLSGESYASLKNKRDILKSLEGNYGDVIALVEKTLEEKGTKLAFNGRTFYEYQQIQQHAENEAKSFKLEDYINNYMTKNPKATRAEAEAKAAERYNELLKASQDQTKLLNDVKKALTDGIIASVGKIDGDFDKIINYRDENGNIQKLQIGDEMKGLKEAIDKANNSFDKHSSQLSADLNKAIDGDMSIRKIKNIIKEEGSKVDANLAKLSELEQSKK